MAFENFLEVLKQNFVEKKHRQHPSFIKAIYLYLPKGIGKLVPTQGILIIVTPLKTAS